LPRSLRGVYPEGLEGLAMTEMHYDKASKGSGKVGNLVTEVCVVNLYQA
jgi:hypothetical protein